MSSAEEGREFPLKPCLPSHWLLPRLSLSSRPPNLQRMQVATEEAKRNSLERGI